MCIGSKGPGFLNPSDSINATSKAHAPDISTWSPQAIQEFLLKYPTADKANAAGNGLPLLLNGFNPSDVWSQVAGTGTGRDFLVQHAANRAAAGDTAESDNIRAYLNSTDPTKLTRLPTLAPPPPSASASSVAPSSIPLMNETFATNRAGTADLRIPLMRPMPSNGLPTINS